MKINQEVFDKTNLTEIEILKGVPKDLFKCLGNSSCNGEVEGYILCYKITNDELEVDYVGIAAILENRAEIIIRSRRLSDDLQDIIAFNFDIPDKDSRLTDEQIVIIRKAFDMFEKLKEEKYVCFDRPTTSYYELPF